jgi:catechol 2,3-dioxygenase-like lactoylglutathione lyase family enzyme
MVGFRMSDALTLRPTVHVSIDVPSLAAGLRFYGTVFGFVEKARPFPTMAILDANTITVCMHEKAAGTPSAGPGSSQRTYERHWTPVHLDVHVVNFDETVRLVLAQGGAVEAEYRTQGPKPAAFCCDPFGNGFCIIGEAPPPRV